jgi:hypothetical protein
VIAADFDWNLSTSQNTLGVGMSEEMKDSFTYGDLLELHCALVTVCHNQDNQI